MRWWTRIVSTLRLVRGIGRASDEEREMREEMAFHLDMQTDKLRAAGLSDTAARRAAALAFGGTERWSEAARDEYRSRVLEEVARDARYALRSLRQHPVFALTVVGILAIGIGANTAIFTLVDALLLRTLPVPHAEQLVTVGNPAAVGEMWSGSPVIDYVSYPLYEDLRDQNHVLSGLYASGSAGTLEVVTREASRDPNAVADHPAGRIVSGNFFSVLGLAAYAGRTFTADEDRTPLSDPFAVISYGYWQRQFNGARSAMGSVLVINGTPFTVIGVMPPGFTGDVVGLATDIWLPMMMQPVIRSQLRLLDDRSRSWLQMMGRLRPGVTIEQARAELTTLEPRAFRAHLSGADLASFEEDLKETPVRVEAGSGGFSRDRHTYAAALLILMAAVGLVMLVVCANVANLMLTRAIARGREMTVRMTLGAGRRRLIQQLLTESVILAGGGAIAGFAVASWGSSLLVGVARGVSESFQLDLAPNWRVFAFTAGVTLVCAALFGLFPALRGTKLDLSAALRAQGRSLAGTRTRLGRFAAGKVLVAGQVALSALLLVGAGLLIRSMQRIVAADLGFDRDHLVIAQVAASRAGYSGARMNALMRDLAERVKRIPSVTAVTYSRQGIFCGGESRIGVTVPGFVARADSEGAVNRDDVGPNYFAAIGAHLVRGRDFDVRDDESSTRVAVINETMAKAYFRGRDPIGQTIAEDSVTYGIVGVVRDMEESDVRGKPVRRFYAPIFQAPNSGRSLVLEVRTAESPTSAVQSIRTALLGADRRLMPEISPLNDLIRGSVAEDVLLTQLTTVFGGIALLVAALGLYGVTSHATLQRTAEFGVRMALGAEPSWVVRLVLREALVLAVVGIAVGVPAGLAAARLIRDQIFGVGQVDLPSIGLAAILLAVMAMMAAYLPARRAARVGPVEALRAG